LTELALELPRILVGVRQILPGDENALMRQEFETLKSHAVSAQRSSGAARIVARELLSTLGIKNAALPKSRSGAPIWPEGIVGSLAHDAHCAIAVVGSNSEIRGLGVDIEPAEDLSPNVSDLVATPRERAAVLRQPFGSKLLFAAKEATYKAVHPLDHEFLEHHDVEIDFARRQARVSNGRLVDLRFSVSTHVVALALVPNDPRA